MAQQLRELVAPVEDPGLIPSFHSVVYSHPSITPVPGYLALSDLFKHQTHTWSTYIHEGKMHRQINKSKKILKVNGFSITHLLGPVE